MIATAMHAAAPLFPAGRSTANAAVGGYERPRQERDLGFDEWSAVWMMNDDGSPMCDRCEQLLNGADPLPPVEITKPAAVAALTTRGPKSDKEER